MWYTMIYFAIFSSLHFLLFLLFSYILFVFFLYFTDILCHLIYAYYFDMFPSSYFIWAAATYVILSCFHISSWCLIFVVCFFSASSYFFFLSDIDVYFIHDVTFIVLPLIGPSFWYAFSIISLLCLRCLFCSYFTFIFLSTALLYLLILYSISSLLICLLMIFLLCLCHLYIFAAYVLCWVLLLLRL